MNTLLGELATLNDVQYPRYRIAFKLRKLQKFLLLDQFDVSVLQESLHLSGVGAMGRKDQVPVSQLHSAVVEMYSCLRVQKPVLGVAKLHQAQELCSNWLQMNYQCSTGGKVEAGSLKVTLCLLSGSKEAEKARYLFSILANVNGAVECCDLAYFCTVTQQLMGTLQEELYAKWAGPEQLWRESLVFVRSAEDIEDEECDGGGIKRQWLSQFEFSKLFTASPEPAFLSWLALTHRMSAMEKVVHPVRCAICTRKPIVSFRYQCTQCSNFNLCQMCFLKGRVSEKHSDSHQMMEFSSVGKGQRGWHHRLVGSNGRARGGHVWDEPRAAFVYSPRTSVSSAGKEATDSPMHAISDMLTSSKQCDLTNSYHDDHTHKPTNIRIGSGDVPSKNKAQKQAPPPTHSKGNSISTTSSGSPDSTSSAGKFRYEAPLSGASSGEPFLTSSVSSNSDLHISPAHTVKTAQPQDKVRDQQQKKVSPPQQGDLTEINRKLSMELDMLLNDLPPAGGPRPKLPTPSTTAYRIPLSGPGLDNIQYLQKQEEALEGEVVNLTNKRQQLAGELEGLISQVQNIHMKSLSLSRGVRTPSPGAYNQPFPVVGPAHLRSDSLPAQAYLSYSPSPPGASPGVSPLLNRKIHEPATTTTTMGPLLSPPSSKGPFGSQQLPNPSYELPDSMAEYSPNWTNSRAYPDMQRASVAW